MLYKQDSRTGGVRDERLRVFEVAPLAAPRCRALSWPRRTPPSRPSLGLSPRARAGQGPDRSIFFSSAGPNKRSTPFSARTQAKGLPTAFSLFSAADRLFGPAAPR